MDVVLNCEDLPKEDGFAFVHRESLVPGGICANVMTALTVLGTPAGLLAKMGDDHYGNRFIEDLVQNGVDTRYVLTRQGGTSLHTFITVGQDGKKAIFVHMGDSLLSLEENEVKARMLDGVKVFYTDLFPSAPALKLARACREKGIPVVFDLEVAPDFMALCGSTREQLEDMISLSEVFISFEQGLLSLSGETDPETAARTLYSRHRPAQGVIVTLGDKGALWVRDEEEVFSPGYRVEAVDSTGAGDAFAAGLIHAFFSEKKSKQDAMAFACACAAVKCTQPGPRLKADETAITRFMNEQPNS
jgi:sugar/nucleoside kinase (ribokinase family)